MMMVYEETFTQGANLLMGSHHRGSEFLLKDTLTVDTLAAVESGIEPGSPRVSNPTVLPATLPLSHCPPDIFLSLRWLCVGVERHFMVGRTREVDTSVVKLILWFCGFSMWSSDKYVDTAEMLSYTGSDLV